MVTREEIHDQSDRIKELFYEEGESVSSIADSLDLREKQSTSAEMVEIGPPSWILRVDCPECDAAGGFTKTKREYCDTDGTDCHDARVQRARKEGYAPEPTDHDDEILEGGDVTECIAMEVLGFDDWSDYRREYNRIQERERRESGFTQKRKRAIKERDGHQCVLCLSGESLHVHHIDEDPTNNEPENLVTLCERCHNAFHSRARDTRWLRSQLIDEGQNPDVVDAVLDEIHP
jgi:5-methylcytosine-specific restriction endonuclease McrA